MISVLTTVARCTLRTDTFTRVMAPAIADAEHRTGMGVPSWREAGALVLTLALAALHDVRTDIAATFDRQSLRTVWLPALAWPVGFACCVVTLEAARTAWFQRPMHLGSVLATTMTVALPWVMTPAAFRLMRRSNTPVRPIVSGTAIASVLVAIATFALYEINFAMRANPNFEQHQFWSAIQSATFVPLLGLAGVALSYSRGWRVAARLAVMAVLQIGLLLLIDPPYHWPLPLRLGRSVLVLALVVGLGLWLRGRERSDRPAPDSLTPAR